MSAFLKALTLIPQLLPVIAALVQQADQLLAGVAGTTKLQSVLAGVNAYIEKIEADINVVQALKNLAEPLIEAAVAFAHSPSTTGAVAAAPSAAAAPAAAPAAA